MCNDFKHDVARHLSVKYDIGRSGSVTCDVVGRDSVKCDVTCNAVKCNVKYDTDRCVIVMGLAGPNMMLIGVSLSRV